MVDRKPGGVDVGKLGEWNIVNGGGIMPLHIEKLLKEEGEVGTIKTCSDGGWQLLSNYMTRRLVINGVCY